jgi:thiamine-phosphate pyrophosphorylase
LERAELVSLAAKVDEICQRSGALFIVNSDAEAAAAVGADGVHLPGSGLDVATVRAVCGTGVIVGRSVRSVAEAVRAEQEGADYIQLGTIFPSDCKPGEQGRGIELIRQTVAEASIPVIAIGGINRSNVTEVLRAGASGVAVVSAISEAVDAAAAARELVAFVRQNRNRNDPDNEVSMKIMVNGKEREAPENTLLAAFLFSFDINPRRVVVELNGEILSRDNYDEVVLREGDTLEVVHFVGGGCE